MNCTTLELLVLLQLLLPLLLLQLLQLAEAGRCRLPEDPLNGYAIRSRQFIRFRCNPGYRLMGKFSFMCKSNGRLAGERPTCAKKGCSRPSDPENGEIDVDRDGLTANVICEEPYILAGNPKAFCNGNQWDRELGVCRYGNFSITDLCDFESENLCGWSTSFSLRQPWKWTATASHIHSFETGPRHDHTFQHAYGGHYMLMETVEPTLNGFHQLVSPIYPGELSLKTACCFKFHYFMFGSGVGSLTVSVKPRLVNMEEIWGANKEKYIKWTISGNQGNRWLEHTIFIDELPAGFLVIFTTHDSQSHLGDIAIDDVQLLTGRGCGVGLYTTTTEQPVVDTDDQVVFDLMNCTNRCDNTTRLDDQLHDKSQLIKFCACDESCVDQGNCCPDYAQTCFKDATSEEPGTTQANTATSTTTTTTTTTTPRTTTSTTRRTTTSTTRRTTTPTTTTTTTTTTTRRPSPPTKSTSTTTSTTTPSTTTTTTRAAPSAPPTHRSRANVSWVVTPDEIMNEADRQGLPNGARIMWFVLLTIAVVVIVASVAYRWRRSRSTLHEKAVCFQNSLAKLTQSSLLGGSRSTESEASAALISDLDSGNCEDVQIEELGVDASNVSKL